MNTLSFIKPTILVLASFVASALHAEDIQDIYELALGADAQLSAAEAEYRSSLQVSPQARSALLPQISTFVSFDRIDEHYNNTSEFFSDDTYNETAFGLSLSQSLYNKGQRIRVTQADSQTSIAESRLQTKRQELILRVAESYFEVLSAKDSLEVSQAEKKAVSRQLERSRERFNVGQITIVAVKESEAQYDLTEAQEIEALNKLDIALENLYLIIGKMPELLTPIGSEFKPALPQPDNIDAWVGRALENSLELKMAENNLKIARDEVSFRRASHQPNIDLNANWGFQRDTGGFYEGDVDIRSIGVSLTMPLYTGGRINSQVTEAKSKLELAEQNFELQKRETTRQTRTAYLNLVSSIRSVSAFENALSSTVAAAEAAEAGLTVGTRTSFDVLLSLRETFGAKRDYSRARYNYILNYFRLKRATGILSDSDITTVNHLL